MMIVFRLHNSQGHICNVLESSMLLCRVNKVIESKQDSEENEVYLCSNRIQYVKKANRLYNRIESNML